MRKNMIMFGAVSFFLSFYNFVLGSEPQEIDKYIKGQPIIEVNSVSKVILNVWEELGQLNGYIIFYNKAGEQSAISPPAGRKHKYEYPRIIVNLGSQVLLEEELDINPYNFDFLKLKGGDTIFAYPFTLYFKEKINRGRLNVEFNWYNLSASKYCEINSF